MPILKRGKTNWKYILIVLIWSVIVWGGIELLFWRLEVYQTRKWLMVEKEIKAPEVKVSEEVIEDETVSWKTYRNEEYRYSLKYPPDRWEAYERENNQCLGGIELAVVSLSLEQQTLYLHLPDGGEKEVTDSYYPQLRIRVLNEEIMKPYIDWALKRNIIDTQRIGGKLYDVREVKDYYRHGQEYYPVPLESIFIQHRGNIIEVLYHRNAKKVIKDLINTITID